MCVRVCVCVCVCVCACVCVCEHTYLFTLPHFNSSPDIREVFLGGQNGFPHVLITDIAMCFARHREWSTVDKPTCGSQRTGHYIHTYICTCIQDI